MLNPPTAAVDMGGPTVPSGGPGAHRLRHGRRAAWPELYHRPVLTTEYDLTRGIGLAEKPEPIIQIFSRVIERQRGAQHEDIRIAQ